MGDVLVIEMPITAEESVNPIVRYTGAIVLLAVVSTPLLLDSVWRGRGRSRDAGRRRGSRGGDRRRDAAARLSPRRAADGARFPSRDDCVQVAAEGATAELDLVFGRRDTRAEADELLEQVRGVGYVDAEVRGDGCARWKVLYDGIESYAQGASRVAEARGAGLEAWLEIEPPG